MKSEKRHFPGYNPLTPTAAQSSSTLCCRFHITHSQLKITLHRMLIIELFRSMRYTEINYEKHIITITIYR